jgi:hypothetical protein
VDRSAFAGCVSAIEEHDDPEPLLFDPHLESDELFLETLEFPFVVFLLDFATVLVQVFLVDGGQYGLLGW